MKLKKTAEAAGNEFSEKYAETVYDLCLSALGDRVAARYALRKTFKKLLGTRANQRFHEYAQAWVLGQAYRAIASADRHRNRVSDLPHVLEELSGANPELEDQRFHHYFRRLPVQDRVLLLLRDRLEVPWDCVSSALGRTEDSLRLQRDQALHRLQEQIYRVSDKKTQLSLVKRITASPRPVLPPETKKNPLLKDRGDGPAAPAPSGKLPQWKRTPWYVRTGVEGAGVAALVLLTIVAIPRLRSFYEHTIDRRLESYDVSEVAPNVGSAAVPGSEPKAPSDSRENDADDSPDDPDEPKEIVATGPIRIQEGEIWRFYIKTESPFEMRPKIISMLQATDVASSNPEFRGVIAPGGIQFDLLIPKGAVLAFREEVDKLAQQTLKETGNLNLSLDEIFTWYRSRSKKPIPPGKTRIIIWLSQI